MIDQQLLMPTLEPGSGLASMTIAELVDLLEGGTSMIDQTLLIPTLKTCVGIPAETIAAIVALGTGVGPGANFTRTFINELAPQHFYTLSQEVGSANFGDSGVGPAGIPIVNTPVFANSVPMASEPITTAALFDGVNDRGLNPNDVDDFDTGTVFAFFNVAGAPGNAQLFGQEFDLGGTIFLLQFLAAGDTVRITITRDGGATNFYNSEFDFSALLTFNTWHLLAARQAGAGVTWFFDNQFFTVADAEVTETTLGNLDNTAWSAETLVATNPADQTILGASGGGTQLFPGQVFNLVSDDRVWTDTELTDLWNLALTNGLNG